VAAAVPSKAPSARAQTWFFLPRVYAGGADFRSAVWPQASISGCASAARFNLPHETGGTQRIRDLDLGAAVEGQQRRANRR
jgi:hypothetical protein